MERLTHRPERLENHESKSLERLAAEKLKGLEQANERPERRKHNIEAARERLQAAERGSRQAEAARPEPSSIRTTLTREINYRNTMASLRHRMKPAARRFSTVIHNPMVENVSETAAKTVMRPSVSLGAPLVALLITGGMYLYARAYGFELPSSIVLISLLIGAIAGLLGEAVYRLVRLPFKR